jgi:YidC/Oxa1 family membrane protein insertase
VIGYISDNLLIPILDFFYGLVPSYGLAIVALTIVIRVALYPLSAGSIRSARRMRIAQPVIQKRQAEIKSRYANNLQKQQEELGKVMKEFGSPLGGMSAVVGADADPLCPVRHPAGITVRRCSLHDQSQGSAC